MKTEELVVEARARITWGEEPSSVYAFLTSNGMSAADATVKVRELAVERNSEIRGVGVKNVLIGATLVGVAGIFFYVLYKRPHLPHLGVRSAKGYGFLALGGFYGLWKLVNGIVCLVRPKSEHGSLSDL